MSGGIAYVYDKLGDFATKCNREMVRLDTLDELDEIMLRELLHDHHAATGSTVAKTILDNFNRETSHFVKVLPIEFKRVMEARAMNKEELGLRGVSDG